MSSTGYFPQDDDVDIKTEFTAAGATWLQLEDDEGSHPKTGKKPSLVVSLPGVVVSLPGMVVSLPGMVGGYEENHGEMSSAESEDDTVDGGVETFADGSFDFGNEEVNEGFPTSPYDQSFEPQMDQAPNATNNVEMYNNMYSTNELSMPFTEAFTGTSNNQSTGYFPQYDGEFSGIFNHGLGQADSVGGNGGMSGGNVPTDGSAYQVGNGYGGSFNAIGTSGNVPLRFNEHNNAQNIPYPIQTSWTWSGWLVRLVEMAECQVAISRQMVWNTRLTMGMMDLSAPSAPTAMILCVSTAMTTPKTSHIPFKHRGPTIPARRPHPTRPQLINSQRILQLEWMLARAIWVTTPRTSPIQSRHRGPASTARRVHQIRPPSINSQRTPQLE